MPPDGGDAADAATPMLTVRVELGPFAPPTPGTDCRGRAVNGRGDVVDAVSDAAGVLRFAADPAAGPWDITVARVGYTALSIVGVVGAVDAPVYLAARGDPARDDLSMHFVAGMVTGQRPTSRVQVVGDWLDVSGASPSYRARFRAFAGAPPLQVIALELDGAGQLLGAAASTPTPRTAADVSLDIALPAAPAVVQRATTRVALPTTGVVTAAGLQIGAVDVSRQSQLLVERSVSVGTGDASVDAAGAAATWTARYVDGELAPASSSL